MSVEILRDCERCSGTGMVNDPFGHPSSTCPACAGSGKQVLATSDDIDTRLQDMDDKLDGLPTSSQMLQKFNGLQDDVDLLKTGVEAIWNKVKDM